MPTDTTRRRGTTTRRSYKTHNNPRTNRGDWGSWGGSYKTAGGSYNRPKTANPKTTGHTTASGVAPGYRNISNTFAAKVQSFRTLYQQTKGNARQPRPTAATFKTFANWVNKGANIYYITNNQINKWCHTDQKYKTNIAAKSALCKRFGKNTIKAVCSSKTGFIVAAAPTWKGKTFTFPY
ncbi:MAG TPA: hypothetical protein VM243_19720 [Phycisphaerae bacterium]|nr:hypothetical protein [Phycisphaerae bacterium]